MLVAVVDYGLYMFRFNRLNHALHEATRYGITCNPDRAANDATRPEILARTRLAESGEGMGILCDDDDLLSDNCEVRMSLGSGTAADDTCLRAEIDLDCDPLVLDVFNGLGTRCSCPSSSGCRTPCACTWRPKGTLPSSPPSEGEPGRY